MTINLKSISRVGSPLNIAALLLLIVVAIACVLIFSSRTAVAPTSNEARAKNSATQ